MSVQPIDTRFMDWSILPRTYLNRKQNRTGFLGCPDTRSDIQILHMREYNKTEVTRASLFVAAKTVVCQVDFSLKNETKKDSFMFKETLNCFLTQYITV